MHMTAAVAEAQVDFVTIEIPKHLWTCWQTFVFLIFYHAACASLVNGLCSSLKLNQILHVNTHTRKCLAHVLSSISL